MLQNFREDRPRHLRTREQEFVSKFTDALEKLPKALDTSRSLLDNLQDTGVKVMTAIGSAINRLVLPGLKDVGDFIENLVDSGVFTQLTEGLIGAFSQKNVMPVARTAGAVAAGSPGVQVLERATGNEGKAGGTMAFLLGGNGFADFLKRALTLGVTAFMHLPSLIEAFGKTLQQILNGMIVGINGFIGLINAAGPKILETLDQMKTIFGLLETLVKALAPAWVNLSNSRQPKGSKWENLNTIKPEELGNSPAAKEWRKTLEDALAGFGQASNVKPGENPLTDTSKGGFQNGFQEPENSTIRAIERNTADTAANIKDALKDTFLGGGAAAKGALSSTNLSRLAQGMPNLGNKIQTLIDEHISSILGSQLSATSGLR